MNLTVPYVTERKFSYYSTVCKVQWEIFWAVQSINEISLTVDNMTPQGETDFQATEKAKLNTLNKGQVFTRETLQSAGILLYLQNVKPISVFQSYFSILKMAEASLLQGGDQQAHSKFKVTAIALLLPSLPKAWSHPTTWWPSSQADAEPSCHYI